MGRPVGTLRRRHLLLVAVLTSCSTERPYRDLADPVTLEDLLPLPSQVTMENARRVVRSGLQMHRRANDFPDGQFGYVFREEGFVQIHHQTPQDRAEERVMRTFVDFRSISSVTAEPYFDFQRIRERYRVTLKGSFRSWGAPVLASRAQPEIGQEPTSSLVKTVGLALDDPTAARQLSIALVLLSGR
jgi:hypothetical protein